MANKQYEFLIKGHLGHNWSAWLDCLDMGCLGNGEKILSGWLSEIRNE